MDVFRVPQRRIPVQVRFSDGGEVDGTLFAPAAGPDGAPGRLIDRLNEEDEHFLALARDGGESLLVAKRSIVAIRLDARNGELEWHVGEQAIEVEIAVLLEGGVELTGRVSYTLRPEKQRILDFLNMTLGFVPLQDRDGVTLFNRDRVIRVLDRSRDS